jgi:1-acyl-sn-glycerol-3-phosphate acyltransferase
MTYSLIRFLIRLLAPVVMRLEVFGKENLPASGAYIAAANHLGVLDSLLVYYLLERQDIILIIAEKHTRYAFTRWLVRSLDAIYIDRFNADMAVMREVLRRLRKGGVLVIAPEGTRSQTGALLEGRQGASFLAAKTGVPIIPVGATGTQDRLLLANLKRLRRTPVTVRIGESFQLPPLSKQDRDAALLADTTEIMCRIAVLLPPEYRGFYADHPRLHELLNRPAQRDM